ncbi:MAG: hypothetical protein WBQ44_18195 [Rhodococcus sp. (in: high G+C Gram-positive bacteria)]
MTLTISQVREWKPEALLSTGAALRELAEQIDGQRTSILEEQDTLAESWSGQAADAAAARIVTECVRMSAVAGHIEALADAYDSAAGIVGAARDHVLFEVAAAMMSTFGVDGSGVAAEQSTRIADALEQAAEAANTAARRLEQPTYHLNELGSGNPPGHFVQDPGGGFTWEPDVRTTTASTVIAGMTTAIKEGLKNASEASFDDVAKNVGRGFGAFGSVLAMVPSIKSDIDDGKDPTRAVVITATGAGAAAGMAAVSGMAVGTAIFPGVGTVGGAVIGLALGGLADWGVTKSMEWMW